MTVAILCMLFFFVVFILPHDGKVGTKRGGYRPDGSPANPPDERGPAS